ncbi:MAG: hypothetical protein R3C32_12845 [Chloroflexota bacterium]
MRARWVDFDALPRPAWDRLLAVSPSATPFSRWTFHRAWWDAYGAMAEPRYLVCCWQDEPGIVAIVPLMTRVSPPEAVPGLAGRSMFMAASYHADYATVLCDPAHLSAVARCVADVLSHDPRDAWDAIDLRRLRHDDPATDALAGALALAMPSGRVEVEQEDVPRGHAPREPRLGGLPRDARQEGSPRDPPQAPTRRGRGASAVP